MAKHNTAFPARIVVVAAVIVTAILVLGLSGYFFKEQQRETARKTTEASIATVTAKLELARQKSDLDGMYLSLKELQTIGANTPAVQKELTKVETALPLLQQIRVSQSDHDHEEIIKSSAAFLEHFPQHPEARRALKESGLIFTYLQRAIENLNNCFETGKDGKPWLVATTTDETTRSDFAKIFYNLDIAEKAIIEAKQRDAHFQKALEIEKLIGGTKNTIAIILADETVGDSGKVIDASLKTYQRAYSLMENRARDESPSDVWKRIEPQIEYFERSCKPFLQRVTANAALLSTYKEGPALEYLQQVRNIATQADALVEAAANPKGNMADYKLSVNAKHEQIYSTIVKWKASAPNSRTFIENVLGMAIAIGHYQLFKSPEQIKPLLLKHKDLISA